MHAWNAHLDPHDDWQTEKRNDNILLYGRRWQRILFPGLHPARFLFPNGFPQPIKKKTDFEMKAVEQDGHPSSHERLFFENGVRSSTVLLHYYTNVPWRRWRRHSPGFRGRATVFFYLSIGRFC
jgi:hypothetical protein